MTSEKEINMQIYEASINELDDVRGRIKGLTKKQVTRVLISILEEPIHDTHKTVELQDMQELQIQEKCSSIMNNHFSIALNTLIEEAKNHGK